ncbi:hypothetical protein X566_20190 [Afipia sp. P52-10]|nr:hypothetical protein X566_20190 [Afipia sp. P52-10]
MTRRILISPDRVSISRPGYDALTSPRTSDYMALDSALDIERPLQAGVLTGLPINNVTIIPFGTTYPQPPAVEIYEWASDLGPVAVRNTIWRYDSTGSSTDVRSTVGGFVSQTGWGIRLQGGGFVDSAYFSRARNWIYIIWKTW